MGRKSLIWNKPYCMECGNPRNLEVHHCWHGTANRKIADKDGLVVILCHHCHMRLHDYDTEMDLKYQVMAEKAWLDADPERTVDGFRERYGKNLV